MQMIPMHRTGNPGEYVSSLNGTQGLWYIEKGSDGYWSIHPHLPKELNPFEKMNFTTFKEARACLTLYLLDNVVEFPQETVISGPDGFKGPLKKFFPKKEERKPEKLFDLDDIFALHN